MSATNIQKAEQALEAARATVTEWQDKARAARSQATELDADAGSAILSGASANDIAVKINAADLQARAFDHAAAEARSQLEAAGLDLLEAHAAEYDRRAAKARKAVDEHTGKVRALLDQLQELDGVPYVDGREVERVKRNDPNLYTSQTIMARSQGDELAREHMYAKNSAAWLRFYLKTGKQPHNIQQLRATGGVGHSMQGLWELTEGTPAVFTQLAQAGATDENDAAEDTTPSSRAGRERTRPGAGRRPDPAGREVTAARP